jgi:chemotaxis response regulator CheB
MRSVCRYWMVEGIRTSDLRSAGTRALDRGSRLPLLRGSSATSATARRLSLWGEEPVLYPRPSIDVLFESAADVYNGGLIGVVLTGANSDGADA